MKAQLLVLFFVVLATAFAEVVENISCYDDDNINSLEKCNVKEVRIDPCQKYPCKVKRGKNVKIEFDFTPAFDATTLENDVFWASPDGDLPWDGLQKNACQYVSCPLKKDQLNSFSYDVKIDELAPPRPYNVKWMIKNAGGEHCCFLTRIIVKK